jgi:hypothetical protein
LRLESGFSPTASTLIAVVLGAVLATVGGFVATQLESHVRRRERERNAALMFGELLSTLDLLLKAAAEAKAVGDPYGSVTMRLLRAARREMEIYDRNREALYDLRDADVRARIQTLVVRLTMPIDGIVDLNQALASLAEAPASAEVERRREELSQSREVSFNFAIETALKIRPVIAKLRPMARQGFESHERIVSMDD